MCVCVGETAWGGGENPHACECVCACACVSRVCRACPHIHIHTRPRSLARTRTLAGRAPKTLSCSSPWPVMCVERISMRASGITNMPSRLVGSASSACSTSSPATTSPNTCERAVRDARLRARERVRVRAHVVCVCVCVYVCVFTCVYMCACVLACACVYVHAYAFAWAHAHSRARAHSPPPTPPPPPRTRARTHRVCVVEVRGPAEQHGEARRAAVGVVEAPHRQRAAHVRHVGELAGHRGGRQAAKLGVEDLRGPTAHHVGDLRACVRVCVRTRVCACA